MVAIYAFTSHFNYLTYILLIISLSLIALNTYNIINFKEVEIDHNSIRINYLFKTKTVNYSLKQIKSYRKISKNLNTDFDLFPLGKSPVLLKVKFSDNSSFIISSAQNKSIELIEKEIKTACHFKTRLIINEYPDQFYFILKKDTQYTFRASLS